MQDAVFKGLVDPGNLVNVRGIVNPVSAAADCGAVSPVNCDTVTFAGPRGQYTITPNGDGSVTVTDTLSTPPVARDPGAPPEPGGAGGGRAATGDGTDRLFNIERLRFTDAAGAFEFVPMSAPATPTDVSATVANGSVELSWTPGAGGSSVTSFDVKVLSGGAQVGPLLNAPSTDTSAHISGLRQRDDVHLPGEGERPDGQQSVQRRVGPVTPQVQVPGIPAVWTTTPEVNAVSVTWVPPGDDGGSPVTSFTLEVVDATTKALITRRTVAAPATSAVVDGLRGGTDVAIRVAATNSVGTGDFSALSGPVAVLSDTTAPTTQSVAPAGSVVTATFSEPVQGVSTTTFTLRNTKTGSLVPATVVLSAVGTSATLTPQEPLAGRTNYTATLVGGPSAIRDLAGNPLATTSTSFLAEADKTPPTVLSRTPAPGATGVPAGARIEVVFSERVRGVTGSTFRLTNAATGALVQARITLSADGRTATLTPRAKLPAGQRFRVALTDGIRDVAGNRLVGLDWGFTS